MLIFAHFVQVDKSEAKILVAIEAVFEHHHAKTVTKVSRIHDDNRNAGKLFSD